MDSEAHEAQGDFYTVEEAAKVLGRTPGRIRQLLGDGTLKGEGGGDPKDPWRVDKWSVHATRDEGPRRAPGRRRSDPASRPPAPGELQGEHPSDPTQETPGGTTEARELNMLRENSSRESSALRGPLRAYRGSGEHAPGEPSAGEGESRRRRDRGEDNPHAIAE